MTASFRPSEPFSFVTPTVGLIAWSLLPSQQLHISCHSLRISSLAHGRKSMADTLTRDIGSDRAAFATLSALSFPGIPTWPGIQQSITVLPQFVRVLYFSRYLLIVPWSTWLPPSTIRLEYESESKRKCFSLDLRTTSRASKIAWSSALKMLVAPAAE